MIEYWFVAVDQRAYFEMLRRDFAWAYLPVPKLVYEGVVTRVFLSDDSNKRAPIRSD